MLNLNIFVKFVKHCSFYHGIAVATFLSVALFWASHMYALRTYFCICAADTLLSSSELKFSISGTITASEK